MMDAQAINPRVAAYAAEVAAAVEALLARECGFGEFYIEKITLGFDGDPAGISLQPDEFGGLEILVEGNAR